MKAIALYQPWATLAALGIKRIETRSWKPPGALIGQRIAIHAGARRPTGKDMEILSWVAEGRDSLPPDDAYPLGCILATVKLVSVWRVEKLTHDGTMAVASDSAGQVLYFPTDPYGDFSWGRYLWELDNVERIDPPLPAKGGQRVWEWEAPPDFEWYANETLALAQWAENR